MPQPGVTPPPPLLLPLLMVVTPLLLLALPRRRRPLGQLALAGASLVAAAAASWRPEASTHGRQDAGGATARTVSQLPTGPRCPHVDHMLLANVEASFGESHLTNDRRIDSACVISAAVAKRRMSSTQTRDN